jgi:hypothetical protein
MHVGETVVYHISEEDDCVWTFALRDAPRLAQIRIDEDPGHGPKERTALRVRPLVENMWIGDEEDVSRRLSIISLNQPKVSQASHVGRDVDGTRTAPEFGHRQRRAATRKIPISSHKTIAIQAVLNALSEYLGKYLGISGSE